MPADECCDCGEVHPYGEGLVDGRCPACLALFEERREKKEPPPAEEAEEE